MKTQRTLSNISYNTIDHFQGVVYDLANRGIIEWCYWVYHYAEEDELKDHIHFILQPSSRLDTNILAKEFLEVDYTNSKPLGVTKKWNFSGGKNGMDNWILYCMHHPGYLASKGMIRKYQYEVKDFGATDYDAFLEDVRTIDMIQYNRMSAIADAVKNHFPFALLVQNGIVPISQRMQYEQQYNALMRLQLSHFTGRKQSHEEDIIKGQIEVTMDGFTRIDDTDEDIPF